jgi:hypothetical protein
MISVRRKLFLNPQICYKIKDMKTIIPIFSIAMSLGMTIIWIKELTRCSKCVEDQLRT